MKRGISKKIISALVALAMLIGLVPMSVIPVLADSIVDIEGTVYASRIESQDWYLYGDATLILDRDITLRAIRGNHNLTVLDQGGHTLKVSMPLSDNVITANGAGHGISVKSFTCDAALEITAKKDGLNIDRNIKFTGPTLSITTRDGDAVYSRNGDIDLTGHCVINAGGSAIYSKTGTVKYKGSYLQAQVTGSSCFCIVGNYVNLQGGTVIATSTANCIVSNGTGIYLAGEILASSLRDYGATINARSGGVHIAAGADITVNSEGYGIYSTGAVMMEGGKLDIEAANQAGVYADKGNITLSGDLRIFSAAQTMVANNGNINIVATNLSVRNTDAYYSAIQGKQVSIRVNGGTVNSSCQYAVRSAGNMTLDGYLKITTDSTKTPSAVLKTTDGGNVTLNGVSSVTLVGKDKAIDCDGAFTLNGATLIARDGFQSGVLANEITAAGGSMYIETSSNMALYARSGDITLTNGQNEIFELSAAYDALQASTGDITINGNVSATSTERYNNNTGLSAIRADNLLMTGGTLTVDAAGKGIETDGDVTMTGGTLNVDSYCASIFSIYGDIALTGTVDVESNTVGIDAIHGSVTLSGDIHVTAISSYAIASYGDGGVTLAGKTITVSSQYKYAVYSKHDIRINTHLVAFTQSSSDAYAAIYTEQGRIYSETGMDIIMPADGRVDNALGTIWNNYSNSKAKIIEIGSRPFESTCFLCKNTDYETQADVANVGDELTNRVPDAEFTLKDYWWERSSDGMKWEKFKNVDYFTPYVVKSRDRGFYLRKAITMKDYTGVTYTNAVYVPTATALTGSIVFTSGAKVGSRLTTARTGVLNEVESSATFQWQHSPDGVNYWSDIDGATNTYYNITASDVGTFLRLVASANGMTGKVVSSVKEIGKAPAGDTVAMSSLTYANGVVTVTRAFANQEYVLTLSDSEPSASQWLQSKTVDATGPLDFDVSSMLNQCVYIHTRLKETVTTLAGTKDKYSMIYTGQGEYLSGIMLKNSSGNPVSNENSKVGRIVSLTASPLPSTYPNAQWSGQTVNWYVNNNPLYPGAVELYKDSACTQPLERDEYGIIKPTTQHTVYYKATNWTYNVQIGVEKTIGYNQTVNAHMQLAVCNENDQYILQSMYFDNIETFPGDEIVSNFAPKPDNAYLGTLTFRAADTNPDGQLTLTADTSTKKLTVNVPEDAEPGIYAYYYLINGVRPANGTFVQITVKEKSATVSFDEGNPGAKRLMKSSPLRSGGMEPQNVPLGSEFILPENGFNAPDGYEFAGWSVGGDVIGVGDAIDVTENVTVTAQWREHVHNMTHIAAYDNDCTHPGRMECWYCEDCGKYFGDENGYYGGWDDLAMYMIPAHGHDTNGVEAVRENEVEATCTSDGGYDMIVYCTICGEAVETEHTTIHATGHTPAAAERESELAPTCDAEGFYELVTYCAICDAEISREQRVSAMLGHDLLYIPREDSCVYSGTAEHWECMECHRLFSDELGENEVTDEHDFDIPAIGHSWGEWETVSSSLCAIAGAERRVCARCGEEEEREAPANHNGQLIFTAKATCTASGYDLMRCSICGMWYLENQTEPLGHDLEFVETVDPTCTEEGYSVYRCLRCGEICKDDFVPALGHDKQYVRTVAATCANSGYHLFICATCGEEIRVTIPATGHFIYSGYCVFCGVTEEIAPFDLNGDTVLDATDLAALQANLLQDDPKESYDVNNDGVSNILDLIAMKKKLAG